MTNYYFIHNRPYTQFIAEVKAYDLKQARKLLRSHFPKPNAWVLGCYNRKRYWKVFKYVHGDIFWDCFVVDYHLKHKKRLPMLIGSYSFESVKP